MEAGLGRAGEDSILTSQPLFSGSPTDWTLAETKY